MSICSKRAFSVSLNRAKYSRFSGVSGTSTNSNEDSSRNTSASYSHSPRIGRVYVETAPNCFRISRSVWANESFGTGAPLLNRRGSRISYRRNALLIGGWPLDEETNPFARQVSQRRVGYYRFAGLPTLDGEAAKQIAES